MKVQLYIITLLYLLLLSCKETITNPNDKEPKDTSTFFPNCPIYDESKYGQADCDRLFSVSYDGKYAVIAKHWGGIISNISLSGRYILNIQNGEYILIGGNENGQIGGNGRAMEFDTLHFPNLMRIRNYELFRFCPYNSNIIVFGAECDYDTVGDRKSVKTFYNIFTYEITTKKLTNITPKSFGKWGLPTLTPVYWLNTSKEGNDVFLLGLQNGWHEYNLQTNELYKTSLPFNNNENTIFSNDSKTYQFRVTHGYAVAPNKYFLNEKEVKLFDSLSIYTLFGEKISFDNRYLLLSFYAYSGKDDSTFFKRYGEIWIVEIEKLKNSVEPLKDFTKINLRYRHCLNLSSEMVFTPHNTILVSMHPSNSRQGNVYEMDLKGNILRKITNN